MGRKARIGIIGVNAIGTVHAEALKKVPEADVVALCDIVQARLDAKAESFGVRRKFADYKDLLKQDDIDAVCVCVPNYLHHVITIAALQAGKHVLCEKPMALNARFAQEMVRTAKAAGKKLQIGMVWRQKAESEMIKEYVEKGRLGRIYHMRAVLRRQRGVPGLGGWFTTRAMSGGGALIDIAVHYFDLIMWLSNNWRPERVSAATYSEFGRRMKNYNYLDMWAGPPNYEGVCDVDDYATGFVRFARGTTFSFEISWAGNNRSDNYIELLGDKGGIRAFDGNPAVLLTEDNGRIVEVIAKTPQTNEWVAQERKFVNAVLGKGEVPATGEQGVVVMQLIDGVYKSSRSGKEVTIGEK